MATQKFFIIRRDKLNGSEPDGDMKAKDKTILGCVWNKEAPQGKYILGELTNHWIITDEEYKKLKHVSK